MQGPIKIPLGAALATLVIMAACAAFHTAALPAATGPLPADTPVGEALSALLPGRTARMLAAILALAADAVLLSALMTRYSVAASRTYLPIALLAVFAFGAAPADIPVQASLCSVLLLLSADRAIRGFTRTYSFEATFRSAFLLGWLPVLYAPAAVFAVMMPVTLLLYRRTLREAVVAAAALALPLLLCSTGWWFAGYRWDYFPGTFAQALRFSFTQPLDVLQSCPPAHLAFIIAAALLTAVSAVLIVVRLPHQRTRVRKISCHFLWLAAACLPMFFIEGATAPAAFLTAVPAAFCATEFFRSRRIILTSATGLLVLLLAAAANLLP